MQTVPVSDIVREVKIILDENIAETPVLVGDADQLQLEDHIRARIIDAVRAIHEAAGSELLDDGMNIPLLKADSSSNVVTYEDGTGYLPLPEDFMRLVIFKLSLWKRPVVTALSDTDPRYFLQKSRFTGIRGGIDKPVCAISTGDESKVLEFYSVAPGGTAVVEKAKYLPLPMISAENDIPICKRLVRPIYYQCAALVALSIKDQGAANLFEIAKSYLI